MRKPFIPGNINDEEVWQHIGIIHIAFHAGTAVEVEKKAEQLEKDGYKILSGPRTTGDGYYEFETLDPDGNRIEVTFH
jgi:lactoylglutathione lyase